MIRALPVLAALVFTLPLAAQQAAPDPGAILAARLHEVISRDNNGHSPSDEEVASFSVILPVPDAPTVKLILPSLLEAIASSDDPLRTLGLTAFVALQAAPESPAAAAPGVPAPPTLNTYKPDVIAILAPALPKIVVHLTDESQSDRLLTTTILGGFTPDPPAALYPPLLAFLKRDDGISPVGIAVVNDLLQVGPLSNETATAIAQYMRRTDQTPDARANLVEAIGSHTNQNQILNKTVLDYLGSDDPSLRARVILSLPALDLSPEVFADTRSRVAAMADNSGENLQVVNAAKAVTPCWTATKMLTGCPVYQ